MRIGPLTEEAIDFVVTNASAHQIEEAAALGMDRLSLRRMFRSFIGRPFTGAFYCGECCALTAISIHDGPSARVHFLATDKAFSGSMGRSITRFFSRFSDRIALDTGKRVEILSPPVEPHVARWFAVMGFTPVSPRQDSEIIIFAKGG